MVLEVINFVDRESKARNISIICKLAPALPSVRGDVIQLQQVILNLIINAFEAMEGSAEGKGVILVTSALEGTEGVRISVRDTGHGIRAEDMPFLFEPFFTTKPGGLGMGLPINRTIVEAQAGRLWAENNPDQGAAFHVVLPVAGEGRR
jgi:signal transduction histidine kinase